MKCQNVSLIQLFIGSHVIWACCNLQHRSLDTVRQGSRATSARNMTDFMTKLTLVEFSY